MLFTLRLEFQQPPGMLRQVRPLVSTVEQQAYLNRAMWGSNIIDACLGCLEQNRLCTAGTEIAGGEGRGTRVER